MKNVFQISILAIVLAVFSTLASCQTPTACANQGGVWDDRTQSCRYNGYGNTIPGQTGTAFATGSMSVTDAFADLDSDGWADLAGLNTVAGGKTTHLYGAIRMTKNMAIAGGLPANNSEQYGLILKSLAQEMSVAIFFDDMKNIWTNTNGQQIIFEYYTVNGFQLGSFSATGYQQRILPDGSIVNQQKCTGAPIRIHITGFKIR